MLRLMVETLQIRPISQIDHATNFEPNEVIEFEVNRIISIIVEN